MRRFFRKNQRLRKRLTKTKERVVEKEFLKEKKDLDTMMFDIVDVKNSNAEIFIKYYINDTTTISNDISKFFFEFENFLKKENAT